MEENANAEERVETDEGWFNVVHRRVPSDAVSFGGACVSCGMPLPRALPFPTAPTAPLTSTTTDVGAVASTFGIPCCFWRMEMDMTNCALVQSCHARD